MNVELPGFEPALDRKSDLVQRGRQGLLDEAHACCAPLGRSRATVPCPACGIEGRPVKPVTLRSLLLPHLLPEVRDEAYRFCASPDCALVYYSPDGAQTFARDDLTVQVGVKERSWPRLLCYCFGHSAESLREEWIRTGKSTALASIQAEVKAGTCQCEVTNPGGACCLGDIITEMRALACAPQVSAPVHDGCAPSKPSCR